MPDNTRIEIIESVRERAPQKAKETGPDLDQLARNAEELSKLLAWNPGVHTSHFFSARWSAMESALRPALEKVNRTPRTPEESDDRRWLRDNMALLWAEVWNTRNAFKLHKKLPHVKAPSGATIPRAAAVANSSHLLLSACDAWPLVHDHVVRCRFTCSSSAFQRS